jgi:hypothetical protein
VNVFRRPGGFVVALTYGRGDWVKNVLAAGQAQVHTRGRAHSLSNPRVLRDPARTGLPAPVRGILRLLNVEEFLWLDEPSSKTSRVRDGQRRQRIRFGRLLDRAVHRGGRPVPFCDDVARRPVTIRNGPTVRIARQPADLRATSGLSSAVRTAPNMRSVR